MSSACVKPVFCSTGGSTPPFCKIKKAAQGQSRREAGRDRYAAHDAGPASGAVEAGLVPEVRPVSSISLDNHVCMWRLSGQDLAAAPGTGREIAAADKARPAVEQVSPAPQTPTPYETAACQGRILELPTQSL